MERATHLCVFCFTYKAQGHIPFTRLKTPCPRESIKGSHLLSPGALGPILIYHNFNPSTLCLSPSRRDQFRWLTWRQGQLFLPREEVAASWPPQDVTSSLAGGCISCAQGWQRPRLFPQPWNGQLVTITGFMWIQLKKKKKADTHVLILPLLETWWNCTSPPSQWGLSMRFGSPKKVGESDMGHYQVADPMSQSITCHIFLLLATTAVPAPHGA